MHEFAEALQLGLSRAEEEDQKKHDGLKQTLVKALSHCSQILDLPPESVVQLLKLDENDIWKLRGALVAAKSLDLANENMADILDLARVARIMEEDEPVPLVTGPTGATGSTGPSGPKGLPRITNSRIPTSMGPIKKPLSFRRC
jgi:hypothetical protein